jgi:hypothetical protein
MCMHTCNPTCSNDVRVDFIVLLKLMKEKWSDMIMLYICVGHVHTAICICSLTVCVCMYVCMYIHIYM